MKKLLDKLNYKGQKRIAVINADDNFTNSLISQFKDIIVDREIDPRFPYDFIVLFVKNISDVEKITPFALHNLLADGVLWFCYPKKTSKNLTSDLTRDHGWNALNESGFLGIRMVAIDNDWSAMRFRNVKFIKSTNKRIS